MTVSPGRVESGRMPSHPNTQTGTFTEHRIDRPDGRTVAVAETGDPAGRAVALAHAAPGSRLLDPDPAATRAAGVRLISVDRPGYGGSTPVADGVAPTIPSHADDIAAALAALGVSDVAAVGWSAGGRVALALAARHPDLVRAAAVVATPAPQEAVPWIPAEHLALLDQLQADPGQATAALAEVFAEMAAMPPAAAVSLVGGGSADEVALAADPARQARLEAMLAEAMTQGAVGMAADIVSYTVVPWGFDLAAVGAPTTAFYGAEDESVPPAHGEWYAGQVPGAGLRVVPAIGHLVALTRWADVLAAVA
jgi:pimeloyl-ACP methyl ester carboxylesterase